MTCGCQGEGGMALVEHFADVSKCFEFKEVFYLHPAWWIQPPPPPLQPTGPFIIKWPRKFTLGNIKLGGMLFPVAETAHARVTSIPRSAEVKGLICCKPCLATTLFGQWTVVTPVSSIFQMSLGWNLCLCMTRSRLKKWPILSLLKLAAWARLVATDLRIDRHGCLFKNTVN